VVYPSTVGTFAMGIVPIDSNCRPPGEIFVDVCLVARSGDRYAQLRTPLFVDVEVVHISLKGSERMSHLSK
jgi:hypothetical protein